MPNTFGPDSMKQLLVQICQTFLVHDCQILFGQLRFVKQISHICQTWFGPNVQRTRCVLVQQLFVDICEKKNEQKNYRLSKQGLLEICQTTFGSNLSNNIWFKFFKQILVQICQKMSWQDFSSKFAKVWSKLEKVWPKFENGWSKFAQVWSKLARVIIFRSVKKRSILVKHILFQSCQRRHWSKINTPLPKYVKDVLVYIFQALSGLICLTNVDLNLSDRSWLKLTHIFIKHCHIYLDQTILAVISQKRFLFRVFQNHVAGSRLSIVKQVWTYSIRLSRLSKRSPKFSWGSPNLARSSKALFYYCKQILKQRKHTKFCHQSV